jgi:hypothetical protein
MVLVLVVTSRGTLNSLTHSYHIGIDTGENKGFIAHGGINSTVLLQSPQSRLQRQMRVASTVNDGHEMDEREQAFDILPLFFLDPLSKRSVPFTHTGTSLRLAASVQF